MAMAEPPTLASRITALAHSRWLLPVLFLVEVAETTIVPLPYEAIFIALCAAARDRIWVFVAITVVGSAVAGAIMYGLGANFADPVTNWLGVEAVMDRYEARFAERGAALIALGGTTPIPSHLINLTAGASGYPFGAFLTIFTASRLVRFALLGGLIFLFGEQIAHIWGRLPQWTRRTIVAAFVVLIVILVFGDDS